jgi:UDP-N-acetylglucosamine 2-epimerase
MVLSRAASAIPLAGTGAGSCRDSSRDRNLPDMKIVSLVDSADNFIRATLLSRALRRKHQEVQVHAGPHMDFFQARAHFEYVDLLEAEVHLELSPQPQLTHWSEALTRVERMLIDQYPDLVILHGDSQATLAGALAAGRLGIPLARLDAGARVYRKQAAHEINRLLIDRLADVVFCHTHLAVQRLAEEGIVAGVHRSGDVGLDIVTQYLPVARQRSSVLQRVGLYAGYYLLAVFRTAPDARDLLYYQRLAKALNTIREPIVFPMSTKVRAAFDQLDVALAPHVLAIEPLGYLDTLNLEAHARAILTDSGGVQREAYHLAVPCITVSAHTEERETVEAGWNFLVDEEADRIVEAVRTFLPPPAHPALFGDGHAVDHIVETLDTRPVVYGQNYDRVAMSLLTAIPVG